MQEIAGLDLQLQLRLCVAVKPEEFFNQYLSQDGNLAQHFVQTILLFPPNFAMGLTVDLSDGCSPELLNEGIEQIGQMIEKLFSWQIIRGRNFSVATHPTKPFGGDFLAPLIKEVCEGGDVARHNRMMRLGAELVEADLLPLGRPVGPRSHSRKPSRFGAGRRIPVARRKCWAYAFPTWSPKSRTSSPYRR